MQIMNMIIRNPRAENSAWPRNIMFDIPQAPSAANKKQRDRLRKQQEQLDAKTACSTTSPPKGWTKRSLIFFYSSHNPKPWKSPRGNFKLGKLNKPSDVYGPAKKILDTHIVLSIVARLTQTSARLLSSLHTKSP